ncbi:MAG: sugar transferase [Actinomycetota bacterium]|nr:sugar transferase [Actinomycetota bacterium]
MTLALGRPATLSQSRVESFTRRIALTDVLVVVWATVGAFVVRFVDDGNTVQTSAGDANWYVVLSAAIVALWLLGLKLHNAYDPRLFGYGPEEYRAVLAATLRLFTALVVLSYLFKLEIARGYLLVVLPAGLAGLVLSRWMWRRWLGWQRKMGSYCESMLVVGDRSHLTSLVAALQAMPQAGYRIVGACCSDGDGPIGDVPVVGSEVDAVLIARNLRADIVACSGSSRLGSEGLRRLGWDLEGTGIGLVLAPGMTQVAGPRIMTRPVAGLPLLHVEAPVFTGPKRAVKSAFDALGAVVLLFLLSPVFLVVSVLVRRDGGPVLYRQSRVGMGGENFRMFKFRSMVVNADRVEREGPHDGAGPLYKLRLDPRVTPLGRILRRTSIDELPQLLNVLLGDMSLVGPRPPLATEVERYAEDVHRRLLVKPGMTGLWQVSGRSDLAWDDAVRLDLYYVENWNLVEDLKILWRTGLAVVRHEGAY